MSGEKGKTGMLEKPVFQEMMKKEDEYVMPVSEIIDKVAAICKENGVKRLDLFGSFATGNCEMISNADKNAPQ